MTVETMFTLILSVVAASAMSASRYCFYRARLARANARKGQANAR